MNSFNRILNKISDHKKSHFWLFLMILTLLTIYMMLANKPLLLGHDMLVHYARIEGLKNAIEDGRFPWYINYNGLDGYGYFIKAFYCDLLLVPFAVIAIFTDNVTAYECMIFIITLLCGISTYLVIKRIYNSSVAAILGALLYTFCCYRLLDLFIRAAIGESFAFIFLPIVLLGAYEIIRGDYKKWYILTIGYSLLIFSHLISSALTFITLIIFFVIYYKCLIREPKRITYLFIAALVTLIITAYYLFPMIEQMMSNTFYYEVKGSIPDNMNSVAVRITPIIEGMIQGVTSHLQTFHVKIGLLLTASICTRVFVSGKSKLVRSADILVIVGLFYVFMSSTIFPWAIFPFNKLSFMQFPWRLYQFSSLFFAIAGGFYLSEATKTNKRKLIVLIGFIIGTCIVVNSEGKNFTYQIAEIHGNNTLREIDETKRSNYSGLEYMPIKVPSSSYIYDRGNRISTKSEEANITDYKKEKGITSFSINTNKKDILELPLIYYKGYSAILNGREITVEQSQNGLIEIPVEQSGEVIVYYKGTLIQKISFYITIISILALCIYIFSQRRKKSHLKYKYDDTTV